MLTIPESEAAYRKASASGVQSRRYDDSLSGATPISPNDSPPAEEMIMSLRFLLSYLPMQTAFELKTLSDIWRIGHLAR
jgi:hypothetical protein